MHLVRTITYVSYTRDHFSYANSRSIIQAYRENPVDSKISYNFETKKLMNNVEMGILTNVVINFFGRDYLTTPFEK